MCCGEDDVVMVRWSVALSVASRRQRSRFPWFSKCGLKTTHLKGGTVAPRGVPRTSNGWLIAFFESSKSSVKTLGTTKNGLVRGPRSSYVA